MAGRERVREGPSRGRKQEGPQSRCDRALDQRVGTRDAGLVRRGAGPQDRRVQRAPRQWRGHERPPGGGLRRRARGGSSHHRSAPLRRPAHGRHGPALRVDRGDEDRRGEDARLDACGLSERAHGPGRARHHCQRLPGQARRGVDGPDLPVSRIDGRARHSRDRRLRRQGDGVPLGCDLRDQHRDGVRLPA